MTRNSVFIMNIFNIILHNTARIKILVTVALIKMHLAFMPVYIDWCRNLVNCSIAIANRFIGANICKSSAFPQSRNLCFVMCASIFIYIQINRSSNDDFIKLINVYYLLKIILLSYE